VALVGLIGVFAMFHTPILRMVSGFIETETFSSEFIRSVTNDNKKNASDLKIQNFELKIPPANLRKFELKSREMAKKGYMNNTDRFWASALFFADGQKFKVKIRIRGDISNHWIRSKKSWRIRFNKKNLFQGRRELDLIVPEDKQYSIEHAGYRLARKLNLLTLPSGFSRVKINSVDYGLYFWMEPLSNHTLERLQYAAGEVIGDDNAWLDNFRPGNVRFGGLPNEFFDRLRSYYKFDSSPNPNSPHISSRFEQFLSLLSEADDARLNREIGFFLDIEKFSAWSAAVWAFGSRHAQYSYNLKWYYSLSTGRFQPILYDLFITPQAQVSANVVGGSSFEANLPSQIIKKLLRIPAIQTLRNKYLWRILKEYDEFVLRPVDEIFQDLRPDIGRGVDKKFLYRSDKQHANRMTLLRQNRDRLSHYLEFSRVFSDVTAVHHENRQTLSFEIIPDGMPQLRLAEIRLSAPSSVSKLIRPVIMFSKHGSHSVAPHPAKIKVVGKDVFISPENIEVWMDRDPKLALKLTKWKLTIAFPDIDGQDWTILMSGLKIDLRFVNLATGQPVPSERIRISPVAQVGEDRGVGTAAMAIGDFLKSTSFPFERTGNFLDLRQGVYTLDRDIILPLNAKVRLHPGVALKMGPGVSLVTYQPITIKGLPDNPVTIKPLEENQPWGSIGVISAAEPSTIRNSHIRGGSQDWLAGIFLSGQLSFYGSDVEITDSVIDGAQGDDGLNIKHAKFGIRQTTFRNNRSDGFDGDWVQGTISNSVFQNNGGDGVDISGADIVIDRGQFINMGDKGISVGEKSEAVIVNSTLTGSKIGIAVKDLSSAKVHSGSFYGNGTAVSAYRKKPMFGGARAEITGALFWRNKANFNVDVESQVALKGAGLSQWQDQQRISVDDLRIGNIDDQYSYSTIDGLRFNGATESPFRAGPKTELRATSGIKLPDLSRFPIGMGQ
jgi:hypothetical protein